MIELILYSAAGFLSATLLALLLLPFMTDRAAKSATSRLKANLPFSTTEMEADKDQLKAAHAVELRKIEIDLAKNKDKVTAQELELRSLREKLEGANKISKAGKLALEEMREKQDTMNTKLRENDSKYAALEARARQLIREKNELMHSVRVLERDAGKKEGTTNPLASIGPSRPSQQRTSAGGLPIADESLALRPAKASDGGDNVEQINELLVAERQRTNRLQQELAELTKDRDLIKSGLEEKHIEEVEELKKAVQKAERQAKRQTTISSKLRAELKSSNQTEDTGEKKGDAKTAKLLEDDLADSEELREKLFDVAANIAKLTATVEGKESPIHTLLEKAEEEKESALSHRIRQLVELADSSEKTKPARAKKPATSKQPAKRSSPKKTATKRAKPQDVKEVTEEKPRATRSAPKKLSLPKAEGLVIKEKSSAEKAPALDPDV